MAAHSDRGGCRQSHRPGFLLYLSLMIDRLHHFIGELQLLQKTTEAAKMQNRGIEDGKSINAAAEENKTKNWGSEIATLKTKIKKLKSDCDAKAKEAKTAETEAEARKKQSEGFLLEYDRLLAENQDLRTQLQSIEQGLSQSDGKKSM
ncbi:hypothetical protein Ddye_016911 [Dipteronia dyeriana]|uniref:Endoplasmic reticulum transmembrane protein n=1 Tax=Dipteronia dyeriana TaxID=168575 RepID=A0AAD9U8J5_9ROSI|nr:hypothetical protein Ddye_016911 [Dipteronia dyeriana]